MNINIRYGTVSSMIDIMKLNCCHSIKSKLGDLLNHVDYEIELKRYNKNGLENGFSKEEVIQFFLQCLGMESHEIKKRKLIIREHEITSFIEKVRNNSFSFDLRQEDLLIMVEKAFKRANFGLAKSYKVEEINVIFSIGLGATGGWFYKDVVHIDIVQFMNPLNVDAVVAVLAHEIHHIGMMNFYSELWQSDLNLKAKFLTAFAGEGLAVKYGNNGSGHMTKSIYDTAMNAGLDKNDFEFFRAEFEQMYIEFNKTLNGIKIGEINAQDMLNEIIKNYWTIMSENKLPKYHSRIYYFGCEIWGLLHDTYGTEKVFDILRNTDNFEIHFNQALKMINRVELSLK